MKKRFIAQTLLLMGSSLLSSFVFATGLDISPIYLEVSQENPSTILTLTNNNSTPMSYEITAKQWSQANNQDILTPTDQLIISPPIVKIQPKETQIIRIEPREFLSALPPKAITTEKSYRVFIDELPDRSQKNQGVTLITNFSLPFFVATDQPKKQLLWDMKTQPKNEFEIQATNMGNEHVRVTHLALREPHHQAFSQQNVLTYILPGQTHSWTVPITEKNQQLAKIPKNESLGLVAITSQGTIKENLAVS